MNTSTQALPHSFTVRSPWHGVSQIVRFNWPFYAVALLVCAASAIGALASKGVLAAAFSGALVVTAFWSVASIGASHWIYDLCPLTRWDWIRDYIRGAPNYAANLHAGFDETSDKLQDLFPRATWRIWDFYDAGCMSEQSIVRARQLNCSPVAARVQFDALPARDQSLDAVFLIFAAHELRAPAAREALFGELHRVLSPGGTLVLVEQVRNAANFAAYGPGAWHFLTRAEWLRLARIADFEVSRENRITPFVRVFLLRRSR